MNAEKCFIFGAGEYYGTEKPGDGVVIAADGGCDKCLELGIIPDIVIGDFDSGTAPESLPCIRLNPVKDETDMAEAVRLGLERGCEEFHIFGGTGGRTAHTFANIQTLAMLAEKGKKAFLYGNKEVFTVVRNSCVGFGGESRGYISVFSLTEKSAGVTESGLKYSLDNAVLTSHFPLGVSNEFTGVPSRVSVAEGELLLIVSDGAVFE